MKSPRISLYDQSHTRAANRSGGPGLEQGQISSCGFLSDSDRKESACNAGDAGSIPRPGRSPADRDGNTSVSLPGEFHVQRSLAGYSPWGRKESEMTEWLTLSLSLQFSALATIRADHYCQPAVPDPEKRASWWPSAERRVPLTEDRFRASDRPTQIPSTQGQLICHFSSEWKSKSLSCVRLFATPWAIQSMEFSRPECWSE